ncbi:Eukaryotic translation initiation factor 2 subunit alpha [Dictyocoela muelleri]|nr:Eukaryotic translation initiation factor 2 subunit alpha [Dictyocoela muelleri]
MKNKSTRFHKNKYPKIGEVVIGKNKLITDLGVYIELLEYECDGLIVTSELSKKRIKNIQKTMQIGKLEVCSVLRIDDSKGYIDLSRKNITNNDFEKCYNQYLKNKKSDNVILSTAKKFNKKPSDLYSEFGWEMAEKYGSIYDFLMCLKDNKEIFKSIYTDTLVEFTIKKFISPNLRVKAIINVFCPEENGVNKIKESLSYAKSVDENIQINLVRHPTFTLTLLSQDKDKAIEILNKACSEIEKSISNFNGVYSIVSEPKVYGERTISKPDVECENDE